MLHHEPGPRCKLCDEKMMQAYSYMREWFWRKKVIHPTLHASWTFRNKADQDKCFAEGSSHAKWPNGPHNRMSPETGEPESYAIDLFQLVNQRAIFDPVFFAKLNAENEQEAEPIGWGGKFKSLGDSGHFQYNPDA